MRFAALGFAGMVVTTLLAGVASCDDFGTTRADPARATQLEVPPPPPPPPNGDTYYLRWSTAGP